MAVTFSFQKSTVLTERNALKRFLNQIAASEGKQLKSLSIVFCSDEYLLEMNNQFLQHDYYTDIITFDLGSPQSDELEAELYISVDRVKDNAVKLKVPYSEELKRVIFHGLLHLCGYGDKSTAEQKLMRKKESHYLKQFL